MAPYLTAVMATMLHLKRVCPKCRHAQVVAASRRRDTVACPICRTPVPPPKR